MCRSAAGKEPAERGLYHKGLFEIKQRERHHLVHCEHERWGAVRSAASIVMHVHPSAPPTYVLWLALVEIFAYSEPDYAAEDLFPTLAFDC